MSDEFKEQGGAATMDPSRLRRWATSKILSRVCSGSRLDKARQAAEADRVKSQSPHTVEYFHQVDDGYSHLAVQLLGAFSERYDIRLRCHLVRGEKGANTPEPALLARLSRYDSQHIAEHYGLRFPEHKVVPDTQAVALAEAILTAQDASNFADVAVQVGEALWSSDADALATLAVDVGKASVEQTELRVAAGIQRRADLKHYSAAMFYYAGEWYWGVDRLYHLENRLASLAADRIPGAPMLAPRPLVETPLLKDNGSLTLEFYASLRSPYTAIVFDRAVALARDTGVALVLRPVLPMVMRGVPATREKGFYIFSDTAREARAAGVEFGQFYDPIGEPVRQCYSLYAWAAQQGRDIELFSSFLHCAFAAGVNTNSNNGMRQVVERAGLDWAAARPLLGRGGWQDILETNRLAMYEAGLWGVPSFRLLDAAGEPVLALWGQDRLWLFAKKIQQLLQER